MSDRVILDRRSMDNESTHDRNECKPVCHVREPVWHLECLVLNHDAHDERVNRRTEHEDQPTYQTEHLKHITVVFHMKIKSLII